MSVKKLLRQQKKKKQKQRPKNEDNDLDELFLEEIEKEKVDCCGEDRFGI